MWRSCIYLPKEKKKKKIKKKESHARLGISDLSSVKSEWIIAGFVSISTSYTHSLSLSQGSGMTVSVAGTLLAFLLLAR